MATKRQHLLDFAVLGLLHEAPMHGYEVRKRLGLALGPFRALSFGTLYPALRGLVADGYLSERGSAGSATSRRPRIVYELTERGRARFAELAGGADDTAYDDEGFALRVAFFGRTETSARLRILEGRRARLEERLAQLQAGAAGTEGDSWARLLTRHTEESLQRDLRWLGELIAAERNSPARPGTLTDPNHPAFQPPAARSSDSAAPRPLT